MPIPSLPEPAAAEPRHKSVVESVTGKSIDDAASSMRFAEARAPAASSYIDGGDAGGKVAALKDALQNVKDQIVAKASQIKSEKKWVKEVTAIIKTYVHKTRRVNANIRKLQKEVKDLFRKKKQIDNLILQRRLEDKLKVANKDLQTLKGALTNVQKKKSAFQRSKQDITTTIGAIKHELAKLQGKEKPKGKKGKKGKKGAKKAAKKKE